MKSSENADMCTLLRELIADQQRGIQCMDADDDFDDGYILSCHETIALLRCRIRALGETP